MGGGVVAVLSFAGSITASAARVVRASVSRENMGGGWYWLAQLKKALEPQGVKRTREGLAIGEQGRFWQGFRSRLGARLGTLAYGVRAEPSALVTNKTGGCATWDFSHVAAVGHLRRLVVGARRCRACFLLALCS